MIRETADVVVVGGGIVGVTSAYFLATKGLKVTLLEQETIGYGASGRNLGFLHMHNRHAGYALDLSRAGRALYDDFSELLGPSFEFRANGAMTFFYTDEQRQVYKEFVEARNAEGFHMELLDQQAAHEAAPILPDDVIGSTYNPEDGQIRTPKFLAALAQECRRLGVSILEHSTVTGLKREGQKVIGVTTSTGDVLADRVVWATGIWSRMLSAEGIEVPVKPHRLGAIMMAPVEEQLDKIMNGPLAAKQYAHIRNLPSFKDEYFTSTSEDSSHGIEHMECVAKTENGNLFIGCPMDYPEQIDHNMPAAGFKLAIDAMLRTFPHYRNLGIESAWTGIVPATADSLPILDEIESAPGLILATGHVYGNLAGPITGKLVSEMIAGVPLSMPIDELSLKRESLTPTDGIIRY